MEESEVSFGFTGEHVRRVRVGWVQQWLGECVARGGDCYGVSRRTKGLSGPLERVTHRLGYRAMSPTNLAILPQEAALEHTPQASVLHLRSRLGR